MLMPYFNNNLKLKLNKVFLMIHPSFTYLHTFRNFPSGLSSNTNKELVAELQKQFN